MITSMHIENFKCFKDFNIDLGPFNVLIGPNDSGKTALLQAVGGVLDQLRSSSFAYAPMANEFANVTPRELTWRHDTSLHVLIEVHADLEGGKLKGPFVRARLFDDPDSIVCSFRSQVIGVQSPEFAQARAQLSQQWQTSWFPGNRVRSEYYHFEPDALRKESDSRQRMEWNGKALPSLLHDIREDDSLAFEHVREAFCKRFPRYGKPELHVRPRGERFGIVRVQFPTATEAKFRPQAVSDGIMLSLAFLALAGQPDPPRALLIEQPEDGVHHASLKDIVETLRQLSSDKGVQVILTTHSPYLLDFVEMDEVQVFQKDEEGAVHAKRLSEFEGAGEISDMFATGEKWSMLSEEHGI